uniref:Uncharacterized protein n=1 Tax=Heterorhabditis bacteriophora TaxID=37862 RepID=A0A1I7WEG0_HETBA
MHGWHNAEIQLRLMMFRDDLRKCREGRAGMKRANHLVHRNDVVGVIITSDTLLENVNPNRLTNTLLQSFNTPHGVKWVFYAIKKKFLTFYF